MLKDSRQKTIAFLVCFIGRLPWYFDYFVHSCKYNPSIDFFIVTDDLDFVKPLPKNVRIIHQQLEEINKRATKKLGFTTQIKCSYKLCDFKPVYGILFDDILKDYDFWGHGDIDIIFGKIRNFMTNRVLNVYDIVSVRHDFLTGQFLLFKNNDKMNNLFRLSKDFKKVLSSDRHFCFDETNFRWQDFTDGKLYHEIDFEVESMTHVVKRLEKEKYLNAYFDFLIVEGIPGKLKWEKGNLTYGNKYEAMLYHLVLFKNIYQRKNVLNEIPELFYITPKRIIHRRRIRVTNFND